MAHYIGLDLGGTNIKCGVTDERGTLRARTSTPTNADAGSDAVIEALVRGAHEVANLAGIDIRQAIAIGVGSPGPIDFARGVVIDTPNLPGFRNLPIRDRIAQAVQRPVVLENDANAAAFAEFWAGTARHESIRNMVMFTLGTGVGSGIIVDGELVHGAFNNGAEAGHMIVVPGGRPCGCGQRGCVEAYASASHTARRAEEALDTGEPSTLADVPRPLDAEHVFAAARTGDALAARIVDQTAQYLAVACINICRVLDPQMIVFAGGMALAGDELFQPIRRHFDDLRWHVADDRVQIAPATLGNDAGVIGAAGVAWAAHRPGPGPLA